MPEPPQLASLASTLRQAKALHQQGRLAEAQPLYRKVLTQAPNSFDALHLLGVLEIQRRNYEAALPLLDWALQLNANSAPAEAAIGHALYQLGRPDEALVHLDRALAIKPDDVDTLINRGAALRKLKRHEEAVASYDRVLAIRPDHAATLNNRGNVLNDLKRHAKALADLDRALALKPDFAEAWNNRGCALHGLKRYQEALASLDRALAIRPDYASTLNNRGNALNALKRHEEAAQDCERLLRVDPDFDWARGNLLHQRLSSCLWRDHDQAVALAARDVNAGKQAVAPFVSLILFDEPRAQLRCAQTFLERVLPAAPAPIWRGERYEHDRIRIAYLSADFHEHATAFLMAGLFEAHDRRRFETTALSFGPDSNDEMSARLRKCFSAFIDIGGRSDRDAALLLREREIDIAVDLKGYTQDCRPGILAFRPAPVQVSYLGYPGTMGADHIDYIIADRIVIPADHHGSYAEKVVALPDSYQANDSKRRIAERAPDRREAGLPEAGFVFCCFNNNYKITPAMFAIWMRLLERVDGSVLWLLADNAAAMRNLRHEAEARGVAPERLVFAPRLKLGDHLARHGLADLFLDTLPCNAHTTASDALWAGLPLVTCLGSSFAGRVAASLLDAVGLPELIARTLDEYETLALALAQDGGRLAALKARLAANRARAPLFDTDRFRRHIESAYETMWQRVQRGEPPASFAVARQS
jgi:protein O-GlcNAc transferase